MDADTTNEKNYDLFVDKNYDKFVETLESENTKKVARSLSKLGEHDYDNCIPIDIEQIILSMKPNSPKAITTISYMLSLYAKYIENDELYHMAKDIDRNALWSMAKPVAKKKFISHSMFENVYKEIGVYEEYNSFYFQTLFRCLYEGIYNDDMSVLKNLRGSDIREVCCEDDEDMQYDDVDIKSPDGKFLYNKSEHDKLPDGKFSERQRSCRFRECKSCQRQVRLPEANEFENSQFSQIQMHLFKENKFSRRFSYMNIVTLKEDDGNEYELIISNELARDLKKLAETNTWERRNRFGTCKIKTTGLYKDSCFKVETRKNASQYSYRYTYYRILRKISKEYLEYNILPLELYISGIMHRIEIDLNRHGIELQEAFSSRNKNRTVNKIISKELRRCNCNTEVKNFREIVIGHLDVFL